MRADKLLMLGVVGLGAYAVYRLSKTDTQPRPDNELKPTPIVPPNKGPLLPENFPLLVGNPIHLTNSRAYRGRLETTDQPAPFSPSSSREDIQRALEVLGFSNPQVFVTASEAAGNFPEFSLANSTPASRWFYGRWLGPTTDAPRPNAVNLIWVSQPLMRPDAPTISGILSARANLINNSDRMGTYPYWRG